MYTKCPECRAIFRVTTEQASIADGLVRCGLCDAVFNCKDCVHKDNEGPDTQTTTSALEKQPLLNGDLQHDDEILIVAEKIPTMLRDDLGNGILSKPNAPMRIALWTAGAIVFAIFFLGQITYWQDVDVLPQSWVDKFCMAAKIKCNSGAQRDLAAIKVLNRNIYAHPNVADALMITSSFVSQSAASQPFPLLGVTLLDTQGTVVATRRFTPEDYLVDKTLATTLMQPDQPVGARLEVFDPGSTVIAYEIEFY